MCKLRLSLKHLKLVPTHCLDAVECPPCDDDNLWVQLCWTVLICSHMVSAELQPAYRYILRE